MDGSLLDAEGYPRSDIDLYAVRTARNRVICESLFGYWMLYSLPPCHYVKGLRNDHKVVMQAVEQKLYAIHAEARESGEAKNEEGASSSGVSMAKAFAKVNSVTEGSPAALAVSSSFIHVFWTTTY